uniref:uncharacterized protein LOC118531941 isoform X2 n=1 Tax=Halichoerus grypus TaxID=9711 RepID=UPI0016599C01|nr:uncharacterized protein LOC118531941 isoform X2 [Halichoerus grypus]
MLLPLARLRGRPVAVQLRVVNCGPEADDPPSDCCQMRALQVRPTCLISLSGLSIPGLSTMASVIAAQSAGLQGGEFAREWEVFCRTAHAVKKCTSWGPAAGPSNAQEGPRSLPAVHMTNNHDTGLPHLHEKAPWEERGGRQYQARGSPRRWLRATPSAPTHGERTQNGGARQASSRRAQGTECWVAGRRRTGSSWPYLRRPCGHSPQPVQCPREFEQEREVLQYQLESFCDLWVRAQQCQRL